MFGLDIVIIQLFILSSFNFTNNATIMLWVFFSKLKSWIKIITFVISFSLTHAVSCID